MGKCGAQRASDADRAKGLERVVNAARDRAELPFEIRCMEISRAEQVFEVNGYRITAFKVNHNVLCYGYTLEILRQGKFSVESQRMTFP